MSFNIPNSPKEIVNRMKASIKSELPNSNPFLDRSLIGALCSSYGNAIYEAYLKLETILNNFFPQDSTGDFLDQWGEILNVYRKSATQAIGSITVNGTADTLIPSGSLLTNLNGFTYQVINDSIVNSRNINDTTFSYTNPFINFAFSGDHLLATGIVISITGFDQPILNTSYSCIVIDSLNIQIYVGSVPSPTGSPVINVVSADVDILSQEYGSGTNLQAGAEVIFTNLITGVNQNGYVQYSQVSGGADNEGDDEYRARVVYAWQNPGTPFSVPSIKLKALEVPGVTRVFVSQDTGIVKVYFTMDNFVNNIPPQSMVELVKEKLSEIQDAGLYPENRFIVAAPSPIVVDFLFSSLVPNTSTMRSAIIDNLNYFFRNEAFVGISISQSQIISAVQDTLDPYTGQRIQSFTLTSPASGVTLTEGQIAVLGTVSI